MDHLERRHCIVLQGTIARVFPLFTPIGETYWVDDCAPEFLHPGSGDTVEGMVFRTTHGAEATLWACVDWDPSRYRVRYARVTPSSRFGFVEVACRPAPHDRTEAAISYTFTALTSEGRTYLASLTASVFEEMIEDWRMRIDRWLAQSPAPTPARS
jgi:hypothetical protein